MELYQRNFQYVSGLESLKRERPLCDAVKLKPQLNRRTLDTGEPRTMAYLPRKDGGVEWCQPKSNREPVWTAGD